MDDVEEVLDQYRARAGLEWQELAQAAGITVSGLRRIRAGETMPRAATIRRLESALNLPSGHLIPLWRDSGKRSPQEIISAYKREAQRQPTDLFYGLEAARERRAVAEVEKSEAGPIGITIPVSLESLQKLSPESLQLITRTLQTIADVMIEAHTTSKEN